MGGTAGRSSGEDTEILELFRRLDADGRARDELAERFQPLVEYLARRFAGRGEPLDDLIQVANIGLVNAIDRFDPSREVQFSTYAAATIVGELKRHFRDKGWSIRVPRQLQETMLRINQALPILTQELGHSPTIGELAHRLDVTEEQITESMEAAQAYSTASLEAPSTETGLTRAETLGAEDPSLGIMEQWATVVPAIRDLPQRERTVLYLRFFKDKTQSEIAQEIGVSQMHVSRILRQTIEQLRATSGFDLE